LAAFVPFCSEATKTFLALVVASTFALPELASAIYKSFLEKKAA